MKTNNTQKALDEFGKSVIGRAKSNLKKGGKYGSHDTSGQLSNSLTYKVKATERSITFDFYAQDYWKFLDYGVQGKISGLKAPKYDSPTSCFDFLSHNEMIYLSPLLQNVYNLFIRSSVSLIFFRLLTRGTNTSER